MSLLRSSPGGDMKSSRNARLFVGVSLVSGFGATAMSVVASVWVLALTGSGSLAVLAGLCIYAPTLLGAVLGALVDRLPRQKTLVWTNLAMAAALLLLLGVRTPRDLWLLYLVMLGYGVSYVVLDAAEAALLPAALPPQALGEVNGLRMGAQEGMKLIAPLAGAGLFALTGTGRHVAGLAAAALAISAGLYALVRTAGAPVLADRRALGRQTREGIQFLWTQPLLRACVLTAATAVAMSGLTTAATYPFVTDALRRPAEFLGVLASAQGAGSILGGIVAGRIMRRYGELTTAVVGTALFAVATLSRLLPSTSLAIGASVLIGVGLPWTVVAATTVVQRNTPSEMLGRVAATATMLVFAPNAVAVAVGAALPAVIDHRVVLALGATACAVTGLLAARSRTHVAKPTADVDPGGVRSYRG